MKDELFNGRDSISVTYVLVEIKHTHDSSMIHKSDAVWLFKEFMNGPTFAKHKARLTLSLDNSYQHGGTVTFYAGLVNHLLR